MTSSAGVGPRATNKKYPRLRRSMLSRMPSRCLPALVLSLLWVAAPAHAADTASGSVVVTKRGTIAVKYAAAYEVREPRNARERQTEILLADVPVNRADMQGAFDPHMVAINLDALRDRNYVLIWVHADGLVSMNATFSKTMTQFLENTGGGLKVAWTVNTPARLEGRLYSAAPIKTMDGTTYTVDLTFAVDRPSPSAADRLEVGGGEPGKALTAFLSAVQRKNWPAIKAASSPDALKMFDHDYNTPAENAAGAADLVNAWIATAKMTISGGEVSGNVAVLDVEGEMFPGFKNLSRVRMVKTGTVWQFDRAARAGSVP